MTPFSPGLRELIAAHTGRLTRIGPPAEQGFGTDLLADVEGWKGRFFVKAMRNRPGWRREQIVRERAINPYVRSVAPGVQWSAEDEEWIVLGFAWVNGREADFAPGSKDLPIVVELLNRINAVPLPQVAREWPETRWDRFADEGTATLFRGDALLHADVNPRNLVIGEDGAWVVDWSWPTRGAAFIDPGMLVVQLVAAGHPPEDAESWAAGCTAWASAPAAAVDAFATAHARMHRHQALRRPDEPWLTAMAEATEAWATYRGRRGRGSRRGAGREKGDVLT